MAKNNQIIRKGLGLKQDVQPTFQSWFSDPLISNLREHQELNVADLTLLLPEELGFCYGVERALDYALQSVEKFSKRRLILLGEIVHNPLVNTKLQQAGIHILNVAKMSEFDLSQVQKTDVVLIPAFGVPKQTYEKLQEIGCIVVDTTCGSVIAVWKRVERYALDGFTTVIHGKFPHEETKAICSHISAFPGAHYVVIRNREEARLLCDIILNREYESKFFQVFDGRISTGFQPQKHLNRIGLANQTTMLSNETLEIGSLLREALKERFGEKKLDQHFRHFTTICRATQDRQDSLKRLLSNKRPELMIVVGGFHSSNTGQLAKIAATHCPTFHVETESDLKDDDSIRHRNVTTGKIETTKNWLPPNATRIGFTSGASTPDSLLGKVIRRVLEIKGVDLNSSRLILQNVSY